MSSRPLIFALTAIAGLGLGWLVGRSGAGEGASAATATASQPTSKRALSFTSQDTPPPRNFAAYLQRVAHPAAEEEAISAIERMSSQEIRALLLEAPIPKWQEPNPEFHLQKITAQAAAKELVRREGIAAVDWAEGTARMETYFVVLVAFSASDPAAAQSRVREFNGKYNSPESGLGYSFGHAAATAAALRGADDLLEVQKIYDNYSADGLYDLAPDFDFAAYFAKCPKSRDASSLMKSWAVIDPDSAAKAVAKSLREGDPNESLIGTAHNGYAVIHGEAEAARWSCAILADVSRGNRDIALRSFANEISPTRAEAMVKALPDDSARVTFFSQVMNYGYGVNSGLATTAALQALDTEELRVQALIQATKSTPPNSWSNPASRSHYIGRVEQMMEKLAISPTARAQWRASLPPEK